jgi:uncharacterized protein YqjF (DUF2071 family)
MRQTWRRLTFLHWTYAPGVIAPLLPPGLVLDTFEGAAFVGLVPFEIHNLRGIPHFPETNVRTYVIGPDGSRAVWFFSLDAARLAAVIGARVAYHLPYFWASMQVVGQASGLPEGTSQRLVPLRYTSRRRWPHSSQYFSEIAIEPDAAGEISERDRFFTARFRLYTLIRGKLAYAQIEHDPWPLQRAAVVQVRQNLIEAAGLPSPQGAPIAHYSAEIDVKIGKIRLC